MKIKNIFIAMMLVFSITSCGETTTSTNEFEETTQWNVNYYYNYEGNSGVYKTVSTNDNSLASKPLDPTREGYIFDNWYKDTYCKIPFNFESDKITADTSLYASWIEKVSYTISWNEVDGVTYVSTNENTLPTSAYTKDEVSFKVDVATEGYEGEAIVKVNNNVVEAKDGVYTFTVDSNTNITVEGIEPLVSYYTILFTLPEGWQPSAENPRLYYWGSETISDSLFTCGASSNMKLLEGRTFYIELDTSITLEGLIIIFDQGSEVKQSFDITTNLPTQKGTYEIVVPDWGENGWEPNSFGVWCFKATINAK